MRAGYDALSLARLASWARFSSVKTAAADIMRLRVLSHWADMSSGKCCHDCTASMVGGLRSAVGHAMAVVGVTIAGFETSGWFSFEGISTCSAK